LRLVLGFNVELIDRLSMNASSPKALSIAAKGQVPLSKKQQEFNRLTNKIAQLRIEIDKNNARNEVWLKAVHAFVSPAAEEFAKAKIALAMTLEQGTLEHKYSKAQKAEIGACILDLCGQAFMLVVPTEEERALYDRWSETSYEEELSEQANKEKTTFEAMFSEMFGVDIDLDELEDSPEKREAVEEEIKKKMAGHAHAEAHQEKRKTKAKEKAEAAKAAKVKAAEELKSKSLRSIYIALAKLIHPDTEADPLQRAVKEEEMKKLSAAYENDDLTTLLAMEMDWIHQQNDHLDNLPEEKLALFIEVLKDQMHALEHEKNSYYWDPRLAAIREYASYQQETGLRQIKKKARDLNQAVLEIKRDIRSLQGKDSIKNIKYYAQEYARQLDNEWW
jgi:hypothetical protein